MKQNIYQFIFFKLMGWHQEGNFDTSLKKCVIIVVPHTSWYDFLIGVFTRGVLGIEINWVGKKELFTWPLKYYFSWMGGAPLNRQKKENKVDSIVKIFNSKDTFRLAIAPEGTRKKVTKWRSGFYYIALQAQVPIVPVAFDWATKTIKVFNSFNPTGNFEEDIKILEQHYKGVLGKQKANSFIPN